MTKYIENNTTSKFIKIFLTLLIIAIALIALLCVALGIYQDQNAPITVDNAADICNDFVIESKKKDNTFYWFELDPNAERYARDAGTTKDGMMLYITRNKATNTYSKESGEIFCYLAGSKADLKVYKVEFKPFNKEKLLLYATEDY